MVDQGVLHYDNRVGAGQRQGARGAESEQLACQASLALHLALTMTKMQINVESAKWHTTFLAHLRLCFHIGFIFNE